MSNAIKHIPQFWTYKRCVSFKTLTQCCKPLPRIEGSLAKISYFLRGWGWGLGGVEEDVLIINLLHPPSIYIIHTANSPCYIDNLSRRAHHSSKHEAFIQCCLNAGPTSKTVGQHLNSIGMPRVCWDDQSDVLQRHKAVTAYLLPFNLHWCIAKPKGSNCLLTYCLLGLHGRESSVYVSEPERFVAQVTMENDLIFSPQAKRQ